MSAISCFKILTREDFRLSRCPQSYVAKVKHYRLGVWHPEVKPFHRNIGPLYIVFQPPIVELQMDYNARDVCLSGSGGILEVSQCALVGLQGRGKEIRHSGARGGCLSQPHAPEREYIEDDVHSERHYVGRRNL